MYRASPKLAALIVRPLEVRVDEKAVITGGIPISQPQLRMSTLL